VQPSPVVEDLDVVGDGETGPALSGGTAVVHLVLQGTEEALGGCAGQQAHAGTAGAGAEPVMVYTGEAPTWLPPLAND
jgi:hypothetical protein